MGKIEILDCTLRDGGYINDWQFGKDAIDFIIKKLEQSGVELIEIGFIKGNSYDENRTVYPSFEAINKAIHKTPSTKTKYVGMIDMSNPIPIETITPRVPEGIDAVRVIFKQDRIEEGYRYVKEVISKGYLAMVQLVSTDTYSDDELVDVIRKFNGLNPYSVYIVDSLGLLKKKDFMRMVYIMDHNLEKNISLGYHSHNNLQQARGNAEAFVELGLKRNIIIDACVFGMGRGAGNLNEELFADYLNECYNKHYHIEPMLEIIDQYLNDIYKNNFWGYSLPFYLSAKNKVHPNYAKFYSEKGTLTEKAFNELLKTISSEDSHVYSKDVANKYYIAFMEQYVDDHEALDKLSRSLSDSTILLIAPGASYKHNIDRIKKCQTGNTVSISIGFLPQEIDVDYVFCSNLRKYEKVKGSSIKILATSNIKEISNAEMIFNYTSYLSDYESIVDNGGIMILKILRSIGVGKILIAGMDGYSVKTAEDTYPETYIDSKDTIEQINRDMSIEISDLRKDLDIEFITESRYEIQ